MYKKITLKNALTLVMHPMPHMESASIGIWIRTGSRKENKKCGGISHFLEHMLFKGTPAISSRMLKEEIEGRGGSLNGFTAEEMTCFLAKVSARHLNIALELLSDMVLHATISGADIERERTVIVEEIRMYHDLPNHRVHDILAELMWPGHPLGLPIAGNIESVKRILRTDLLEYKQRHYTPENMAVILCGSLKQDTIIKRVEELYKIEPAGSASGIAEFNNTQKAPSARVLYKDTEQTHLSMGFHSFGREHKDRYVLNLLNIILGGNMSSRLFENIREKKGLAYEIGTEIKRYKETGSFIIHAGIEHKKTRETISAIIKELKTIKRESVPGDELKRAKEFLNVQLLLALEDTTEHMFWIGDSIITTDKLPDKNDIIKRINSITSEDITRVAAIIFKNNNLNMALIGAIDEKEKKKIEEELNL